MPVSPSPEPDLADFRRLVEVDTNRSDYPHASELGQGVVVYAADAIGANGSGFAASSEVRTEMARALSTGPGIIAIIGGMPATAVDRVSAAFERIIAREREEGIGAGDHYAKPGANERVWNALEKLALVDPEGFVDYYGGEMIDLVAQAWLGPGYQITSQVNVVNPGGDAQEPHRDYHLGFMTDERAAEYPHHAHLLSPVLTLQGAVAHVDTPVESGSTMLLPHSQKYELGYLAWRRPEFRDYFAEHRIQLDLRKGDMVFFNPAVFHGAGTNHSTDIRRMANLLQVSSAMGRAMESVDRARVVAAVYPALAQRLAEGAGDDFAARVVAASAEGYAFPTNLDRDPPLDGLTPPSQQEVVLEALRQRTPPEELAVLLEQHADRRLTV